MYLLSGRTNILGRIYEGKAARSFDLKRTDRTFCYGLGYKEKKRSFENNRIENGQADIPMPISDRQRKPWLEAKRKIGFYSETTESFEARTGGLTR